MEPRTCLAAGSTLATIGTGADYTLKLNSTGRVAVAEISPEEYGRWSNATASFVDFQAMSRRIYASLPDDYDFLFFVNNQESPPPGTEYAGLAYTVKSDAQGVGQSLSDNTASYGSSGRLRSAIHLTVRDGLRNGPSLHEIAHSWGNSLSLIDAGEPGHWGFSSVGGQLGGWQAGTLRDLGGGLYDADGPSGSSGFGTFANGGNGIPYSQLELYVMGLIGPEEVTNPIQVARDASFAGPQGIFRASRIDTYSIQDIIASDGARSPSASGSQKSFRGLAVVLTQSPLDQASLDRYDDDVEDFGRAGPDRTPLYNFWEATGGRATLRMSDTPDTPIDEEAPTVRSVRKVVQRRKVREVVLEFSEPMQAEAAGDPMNYLYAQRGRDRKFGTRDDRTMRFSSVSLAPNGTTVTLRLKRPLVASEPFMVLVHGLGVFDQGRNPLDGNGDGEPGDDFVGPVSRKR